MYGRYSVAGALTTPGGETGNDPRRREAWAIALSRRTPSASSSEGICRVAAHGSLQSCSIERGSDNLTEDSCATSCAALHFHPAEPAEGLPPLPLRVNELQPHD